MLLHLAVGKVLGTWEAVPGVLYKCHMEFESHRAKLRTGNVSQFLGHPHWQKMGIMAFYGEHCPILLLWATATFCFFHLFPQGSSHSAAWSRSQWYSDGLDKQQTKYLRFIYTCIYNSANMCTSSFFC